jgi:hypothetical protein
MCVYCKGASQCDHERDACEASRGERCITCGHGSAAFLSYPPGPRLTMLLFPKAHPRTRKPLTEATQASRARTNKKAR